jgi:putative methyltransferase (TIGR04325 family)
LANQERTIPVVTAYRESLLPLLSGIVYAESGSVKILDFGGGLGLTFYQVTKGMPKVENLEFHIAEVEKVCEAGGDYFKDEPNIFFHIGLPRSISRFDIVHIGSSLQYVDNWQAMIGGLCGYQPRYILFTDLPAGDIPTYASAQYYYGSKMPCWFFNVKEITGEVCRHGYGLVFKASYVPRILNEEQPYPQANFGEEHRLGYPCILLFHKVEGM